MLFRVGAFSCIGSVSEPSKLATQSGPRGILCAPPRTSQAERCETSCARAFCQASVGRCFGPYLPSRDAWSCCEVGGREGAFERFSKLLENILGCVLPSCPRRPPEDPLQPSHPKRPKDSVNLPKHPKTECSRAVYVIADSSSQFAVAA